MKLQKIQHKKLIGKSELTFFFEVEDLKEGFKKIAEVEMLPSKGPNGESDLRLAYRVTKENYEYYSVICDSVNKEFRLGQSKDGGFYPKGWHDVFSDGSSNTTQTKGSGLGSSNALPAQNTVATPVATKEDAPQLGAMPNLGAQVAPTAQATTQPAQQTTPQAPAPAPAGNGAVNDILAKYGIGN